MSGELLREGRGGHECDPPGGPQHGSVWRCDCRRWWQKYGDQWLPMAWLDRLLFRMLHR